MKILNNIIGLMAVFCVVGGANAAGVRVGGVKQTADATSPRVSVASPTTAAARRLPTMILPKNTSSSSSSSIVSRHTHLVSRARMPVVPNLKNVQQMNCSMRKSPNATVFYYSAAPMVLTRCLEHRTRHI